ncbi:dihydrodipicolinate synthase family protein [Fodinicola feengrottensis]|uniref:Dihydrodipicolinate synthase family protein n=1 Tax=Fodinicola feengrottensis TaxID=435914 RepID=A0ABN2HYL0_9ACTN|nr:dihydrodipicolinate synthase family protein [Fodinicola feengrottensis]
MILHIPTADGSIVEHQPAKTPHAFEPVDTPLTERVVFAAAHVVADPLADNSPGQPAVLDWDATLAFRRHLWSYGLGVAEAMDTAQRGMGLDWPVAAELIRRSGAEASACGGAISCGVGTDQLASPVSSLHEIVQAYLEQLAVVEEVGGQPIVMASRALAAFATSPDEYEQVYGTVLRQASRPAILHWLGPMFDPALSGYWGSDDLDKATDTLVDLIVAHQDAIDGVKVSLLDADREVELRRRLPAGVRCYSGDDFHYPELITGDKHGHSDALLGIFDPLAGVASTAVRQLADDPAAVRRLLDPTVEFSRHLFGAPTRFYKTGVVFVAWLAGFQDTPRMVGGLESARSVPHLARAYVLADRLGLFPDPDLAATRVRDFLRLAGVDQ